MSESTSAAQLKLITWNVERASVSRFKDQLAALQEYAPDVVALQEVGVKASRRPRQLLQQSGFEYSAHSHKFWLEEPGNSSGCAFASRWPFRVLPPETFEMPAKHQALSAEFFTPFGRIEGHTVHVLPGSMVGKTKVKMFEGIYDRLAEESPPEYRFLCGDFNSPKDESSDDEVTVWGSDSDWIEAERSVMVDLANYDLTDAYRQVNGYDDDAYSWVVKYDGSTFPRRSDHVFASQRLNATGASYLHEHDDLSDHTPLKTVFTPEGGLEETGAIDRSTDTPSVESTGDAGRGPVSYQGLTYAEDIREINPKANYRMGRFKVGWNNALNGAELGDDVLEQLTWQNLGWRLGKLFGDT